MNIINPNKKYNSNDHLVYSCQYHIIFCPKFRKRMFVGELKTRLKEILLEVSEKYDFEIIEMTIMPDHVHLIIDCNPKFGIMECVRKMKSASARTLRAEFPKLTTSMPNLWTRSTFISTAGDVSLEAIKQYIEDQKNM